MRHTKILSLITLLILLLSLQVCAFAEEDDAVPAEEAVPEAYAEPETAESTALTLSVSYDQPISCGEETVFTLTASGGSGDSANYIYRLYSIFQYVDGEYVDVYDVSYGNNSAYQTSNTFSFTFYASGTYYIRFSVMDKSSAPYQTANTGLKEYPLVISDADYPSVDEIVASAAAECNAACSTDFDKALWLHDWLIGRGDYDYSYSYCSAEGVLARGKGTCESYHRAYVKLLNAVGIETGRITGNGHVWTAVKMDGAWYQVDTTWDDMGKNYSGTWYEHVYFGLTDALIGTAHTDHTGATAGFESDSLADNYFIRTGKISQWSDSVLSEVRTRLAGGETDFTVTITDSMAPSYNAIIYSLVAYQLEQTINAEGNYTLTASYSDGAITCTASAVCDHQWNAGEVIKEPTCTAVGTLRYTCTKCQATEDVEIPMVDHTAVIDEKVEPTCTKAGRTAGSHCSVCGKIITAQKEIPATGHTAVADEAVAPTCTKAGKTAGSHCSVCGKVITAQETVPAKGHTAGTAAKENYIAPTYTAEGSYDSVIRCTVCNKVISRTHVTVPMRTGWVKQDGKWYYYTDGSTAKGWKQISGTYYYFNADGSMKTGWLKSGTSWYYLKSGGAMATGWLKISGSYYYFKSSGAMVTGWYKVGSATYYFRSGGAMATGWLKLNGTYYYLKSSGAMVTGWYQVNGTYYYFASSGGMYANKWVFSGGNWYYMKASGAMAKSETLTINGKQYTFDEKGVMQ